MLTTANFIRSVLPLGLSQMVTWVCTATLVVVLPRHLGDVSLGKLGIAFALVSLIALLADFGAPTYVAREVARDPGGAPALTANTLAMRLPLAAFAALVAIVVVNIAGYDEITKGIVYVLCPYILCDALAKIALGSVQGLQQMRWLALGSVVGKVAFAGLALVLFLTGFGGPIQVGALYLLGSLPSLAVGLFALQRAGRLPLRIDWSTWRLIFLGGIPFLAWQAAWTVYGQIDTLLLSFLSNEAVVGWYGAAYKLVLLPAFVPTIVLTVALPALAAAAKDSSVFNAIARRAMNSVVLLSVPMAFGIMMLPFALIGFFGYPAGFVNSGILIVLLAPHLALAAIDSIIGTVLATRDKQKQWALTGVAAALLNPALNLVAIPYTQTTFGNGAIGAAVVTTLTEVFLMVVGLRLLPTGVYGRETLAYALKCLTVGMTMAGFVWLARDYPIALPIGIGVVVYGLGALAIGAVSLADARGVVSQLMARAGARTSLRVEPNAEGA